MIREETVDQVRRAIATLPDREMTIIAARFGIGGFDRRHTLEEIADDYGLSKERVRQLEHESLRRIREVLEFELN